MKEYLIYLPYSYWIKTRIKNIIGIIWYLYAIHFQIILFLYFFSEFKIWLIDISLYLILFTWFMTIYEIFYLQNDLQSIKKEINPTNRKIWWINPVLFILLRLLFFILIVISSIYYWFFSIYWLLILLFISLIFYLHNIILPKFRWYTFLSLWILKIFILWLFWINNENIILYSLLVLILSIFISIPYFIKKKLFSIELSNKSLSIITDLSYIIPSIIIYFFYFENLFLIINIWTFFIYKLLHKSLLWKK